MNVCQQRSHHFACRGACVREEYLKHIDDRVLGGRLRSLYATNFADQNSHVQFHNHDPPPAPSADQTSLERSQHFESVDVTAAAAVEKPPVIDPFGSPSKEKPSYQDASAFGHQRQASQTNVQPHLDTTSYLQHP